MTARLELSRVLLIFGLDGDNNIQDPATRCFVTFLHNGRVQISTNTTNNSAGHTRGCWVLGSCLVLTKTRSQDHLPLITTCPVHHRASAELNQSGTNWTLSFALWFFALCKNRTLTRPFPTKRVNASFRSSISYWTINTTATDWWSSSWIHAITKWQLPILPTLATIQASTSYVDFVAYSQFLNCLFNSIQWIINFNDQFWNKKPVCHQSILLYLCKCIFCAGHLFNVSSFTDLNYCQAPTQVQTLNPLGWMLSKKAFKGYNPHNF